MSAFDRTGPNCNDELSQRLLCSLAMDVPPARSKAATMTALGLASGMLAVKSAAAAAGAVQSSVAAVAAEAAVAQASSVGAAGAAAGNLGVAAGKVGIGAAAGNLVAAVGKAGIGIATAVAGASASGVSAGASVSGVVAGGLLKTALLATVVGVAVGSAAIGTGIGVERLWTTWLPTAVPTQGAAQAAPPKRAVPGARSHPSTEPRSEATGEDNAENRVATSDPAEASEAEDSSAQTATVVHRQTGRRGSASGIDARRGHAGVPSALIEGAEPQSASVLLSTLQRETAQLDRVRAALRRRDAAIALNELRRYRAEFPGGTLRPEAEVLHIEVVMQSGDVARARTMAGAFVERHPSSPLSARLRRSLDL